VSLNADENIAINAAQNKRYDRRIYDEKKSGIFSGGSFGITIGTKRHSQAITTEEGYLSSSTLGSLGGDVTVDAGKDANMI